MASSPPWPFDDDDRPSGSVRPLSQADLQAILAHPGDDPTRGGPGAPAAAAPAGTGASVPTMTATKLALGWARPSVHRVDQHGAT
jgi:hypothetical protein